MLFWFFYGKFWRSKAVSLNIDFKIQIYAYARCEGKNVKDANLLNTMYWAAFGVHRFLAVFLAKYIQPIRYMALALGCKLTFLALSFLFTFLFSRNRWVIIFIYWWALGFCPGCWIHDSCLLPLRHQFCIRMDQYERKIHWYLRSWMHKVRILKFWWILVSVKTKYFSEIILWPYSEFSAQNDAELSREVFIEKILEIFLRKFFFALQSFFTSIFIKNWLKNVRISTKKLQAT